jgi:6-phosphogluconolactonase
MTAQVPSPCFQYKELEVSRNKLFFIIPAAVLLGGCGGSNHSAPHTLGGTVSGLYGSRLVLTTNGLDSADKIGPAGNGSYADLFGELPSGTTYNITVATQPTYPSQTCIVANGSGTIGDSDITNVTVTCTTNPGRFVYAVPPDTSGILGYAMDPASGAWSPIAGSPFPVKGSPVGVAVDPTGSYVYVVHQDDFNAGHRRYTGGVAVLSVDRGNGALSLVNDIDLGTNLPFKVGVDPSGKLLLVSVCPLTFESHCTAAMLGFTIDHGALTPVAGSPFADVGGPCEVRIDPLDRFVFLELYGEAYGLLSINPKTGSVTVAPQQPSFFAGLYAITPSGKFGYSTSGGVDYNKISGYAIDATTGALTLVGYFPAQKYPAAIAVDPLGKFAYALADGISAYTVDASTGALTPINGSPFPINDGVASLAYDSHLIIDPTGQFLYVTNRVQSTATTTQGATIAAFKIDRNTGALTPLEGSPFSMPAVTEDVVISN